MKDFMASTFGLVIAYIIPGTALLYSLSLWAAPADALVTSIMAAKADAGLTIGALIVVTGLELLTTVIRGLLFETIGKSFLPDRITGF